MQINIILVVAAVYCRARITPIVPNLPEIFFYCIVKTSNLCLSKREVGPWQKLDVKMTVVTKRWYKLY